MIEIKIIIKKTIGLLLIIGALPVAAAIFTWMHFILGKYDDGYLLNLLGLASALCLVGLPVVMCDVGLKLIRRNI